MIENFEIEFVKDLTDKFMLTEAWNPKETYPTFILPEAYDVETAKKLHERAMAGFKNAFPQEYEEGLIKIENNIANAKEGQPPAPLAPLNLPTTSKPTTTPPASSPASKSNSTATSTAPASNPATPPVPPTTSQNTQQTPPASTSQGAPAVTNATTTPNATTAPAPTQNTQNDQNTQASQPSQATTQTNGSATQQQQPQQQTNSQPTKPSASDESPQQNGSAKQNPIIYLKRQPAANQNNPPPTQQQKAQNESVALNESVEWAGEKDLKPEDWDKMTDEQKESANKQYEKQRKKIVDDFYKNKGAERSKRIDELINREASLVTYLSSTSDPDMEEELERTRKELNKEQKKQSLDQNIQRLNLYTIRFSANFTEDWYKRKFKHGLWNGMKWGLKNLWKWANSKVDDNYKATDIQEMTPKDQKALAQINETMMRKVAGYYLTQFAGGDVAAKMLKTGAFAKLKNFLFAGISRANGTFICQFRLAEDEGQNDGIEAGDEPDDTTGEKVKESTNMEYIITKQLLNEDTFDSKMLDKFLESEILKNN